MHLTNYSLNKHSKNFVKNGVGGVADGQGSKWSLLAFKRRLEADLGAERAAEVWKAVDDLVLKTMLAAQPPMVDALRTYVPAAARGEPNRSCFQVFGFDVMLDAEAKPWLLEVNLDPALRTESPLDLSIKSSMLVDLLNVVGADLPPSAPSPPAEGGGAGGPPESFAPGAAGSVGAAGGGGSGGDESGGMSPGMSELEKRTLHHINLEFTRSKGGKWRRLFPAAGAEGYLRFVEPRLQRMHTLPFDL